MGELNRDGLGRLYLLYGPEDYLRETYLAELKRRALGGEEDQFSLRRLDGGCTLQDLSDAVNAMPFMTERTLTEVRGFDLNRCSEEDSRELETLLSDLPEWGTLVFAQGSEYDIDWRRKAAKSLKKHGKCVSFTAQPQQELRKWILKRFAALGKSADTAAAEQLIFASGEYMGALLPEIEKISAAVPGERITGGDVERYAHHIPSARVFAMTDCMAARDFDGAAALLAELLASGEDIQKTMGAVGSQFRRLYAARLAMDEGLGDGYLVSECGVPDFIARKLSATARGFTLPQLRQAVEACCQTAYALNSSAAGETELMKQLLISLALGARS